MIYLLMCVLIGAGVGGGLLLRGRQVARLETELAETETELADAYRELTATGLELAELKAAQAALSGPLDPDIDAVPPFGDPDDDDDPEGRSGPPGASEAELDWAAEHVIRDTQDPRFFMPENRHALRLLREGGYRSEFPVIAGDPEDDPAGDMLAAQIAAHTVLVDSWLAQGCPGALPAWPELVTA